MAIVLRQWTGSQINKCPRCDHLNLKVAAHNGWIGCTGCPTQFQVSTENEHKNGETYSTERSMDDKGSGEERSDENGIYRRREIISPASLPKENTTMTEKQHNNGKLFFGRIQILYENNTPEATPTANSLDNDVKKIFILHITRGTPAGSCYGISQQIECKRSLHVFISTALLLPIIPEDTAKQFSLDDSIKDKLQSQIDNSTIINQKLQEQCQDLQDTTLKNLRDLIQDIKNYVRDAQTSLPAVKPNLERLIQARMAVMPDTGDLGSVKQWAHLIKLESKAILDVVEGVSARLQHFRTLLWIDEGDINREIKYLNHQSKVIGQGTNRYLTAAVETLRALAVSADQSAATVSVLSLEGSEFFSSLPRQLPSVGNKPKYEWIPLVGLVPQQVIAEHRGKIHFDYITRVSESKDERDILERTSLTCIMMMSYWQRIHGLLEPANKAVQRITGLLTVVQCDLETIDISVSDLMELPFASYITATERCLDDLEKHTEDLWNSAFIGDI